MIVGADACAEGDLEDKGGKAPCGQVRAGAQDDHHLRAFQASIKALIADKRPNP
jgi:hypothetical protein